MRRSFNGKNFSAVFFQAAVCSALTLFLISGCSIQPNQRTATPKEILPAISSTLDSLLKESMQASPSPQMKDFTQQVRQNPTNPDLLYAIGYSHMESSDSGKNVVQHDLAIRYYNEALKLVPGNNTLLRALYNIYYEDTVHNRNPTAFDSTRETFFQINEARRKDLNPPSLARYVIMNAWFEHEHKKNNPALRKYLLTALQEQPTSETSYVLLANNYIDEKHYSLAIATLKLGIENVPKSAELFTAIAQAYERKQDVADCGYDKPGDILGAAKYYKLAIAEHSDNKSLHYGLSRAFLDLNLSQLAINEAEISLSLEATADTLSTAAERYSMLGQFAKSQKLLQQALDKGFKISDPGYHEMMMNQGDWKNAYKGFNAYAKTLEKISVYDIIKNDIIAQQAHQAPLDFDKKVSFNSNWEQKLFGYWTKTISDTELQQLSKNTCEKTEYYFYTGYKDFADGKTVQAKTKFTEAVNQKTYRFIERPLARYFLTR